MTSFVQSVQLLSNVLKSLPIPLSVISLAFSFITYFQGVKSTRLAQRAYVYHSAELVNRQELIRSISDQGALVPVELLLNMKDYGSTPALKLNYTFSYTIPANTILRVKKDVLSDVDIPPGEARPYSQRLEFTSSKGGHLDSTGIYTGLTGKVTYEDVFGGQHEVSVCYVVIANANDAKVSLCQQEETGTIPPLAVPSRQRVIINDATPNK